MGALLGVPQRRSYCSAQLSGWYEMVGERGFEPPTPWSRTRCSTRLSHSPNLLNRCSRTGVLVVPALTASYA
jgi:hypothetical protein